MVAIRVLSSVFSALVAVGVPVREGDSLGAFVSIAVCSSARLARTYAVVAICVLSVATSAVGAVGVPVNAGDAVSALDEIADAIALNSSSSSVPLTILPALPEGRVSLVAKLVAFV